MWLETIRMDCSLESWPACRPFGRPSLQVNLVTKGLAEREAKLRASTEELFQHATAARQELACFRSLAANEVRFPATCPPALPY